MNMSSMTSQGPTVTAVAIVFAAVSFFALVLRIWARVFVVKSVGADDYLICVAVLLAWGFIGCTIAAVQRGLGSHFVEVEARGTENMISYLQIVWLSSIFYNACLGFIKVSVLALYMRLGDRLLRRLAIGMLGVIICQAGANVLACIFQCSPIKAAYDITVPPEEVKCVNINAFYLANAAVNIFTDILTYSLPIPMLARLQIPRRQKVGLCVILGLGLFACISSIIRITYIPPMLVSNDPTWVITGAMYWSVIETNVGILAASIPSYKAIAKKYAPRLLGSSGDGSRKLSGFKLGSRAFGSHGLSQAPSAGGGVDKLGLKTEVKNTIPGDNSSEEALFTPLGRIGVKTEIVHRFDDVGKASSEIQLPIQGHANRGSIAPSGEN